jgi:hypothetical protein
LSHGSRFADNLKFFGQTAFQGACTGTAVIAVPVLMLKVNHQQQLIGRNLHADEHGCFPEMFLISGTVIR